jgi:hypothetical protein
MCKAISKFVPIYCYLFIYCSRSYSNSRILNNITFQNAKNFNFININFRKKNFILLDLFYQNNSNEPKMIKIQSLDYLKTEIYKLKNFENT